MNDDLLIVIVMSIVLVAMALMTILGKIDELINLPHKERLNMARARWTTGGMLLSLAIALPLINYLEVTEGVSATIVLSITIVFMVVTYTWARRRD